MTNEETNQTTNNPEANTSGIDGSESQEGVKEEARDEKGRFKPGTSGNPGGRPKRKRLEDYFSETEIEELVLRVKQECKGEKTDILKMTVEQIFGKPKQPLVGDPDGENPISISILNKATQDDLPINNLPTKNTETQETA